MFTPLRHRPPVPPRHALLLPSTSPVYAACAVLHTSRVLTGRDAAVLLELALAQHGRQIVAHGPEVCLVRSGQALSAATETACEKIQHWRT